MTYRPTRREALAFGLGAAALAGLPAFALEDKGYALGDVVIGDPDAPVTIIEYASLTCPHCASFHVNAWPQIKADYVDTGKVKFILREVYFDQFGLWSAMIARCAGTEGYPMLIGKFLERQRGWYLDHVAAFNETKNAAPIIEEMMKIGRLAGLSNERMNSCLGDQALLERMVGDFQTNSAADGVRSTPTFLVNGEVVSGSVPAGQMAEVIERKLAGG